MSVYKILILPQKSTSGTKNSKNKKLDRIGSIPRSAKMCLLHLLRPCQKVLCRIQVLVVLVLIVIEIFSVESYKQAKNICSDPAELVVAEFDLTFRCADNTELSCGTPQRRAILLRTLLDLNITTPTVPNMIVVYR